jgi:hypothetical protein
MSLRWSYIFNNNSIFYKHIALKGAILVPSVLNVCRKNVIQKNELQRSGMLKFIINIVLKINLFFFIEHK